MNFHFHAKLVSPPEVRRHPRYFWTIVLTRIIILYQKERGNGARCKDFQKAKIRLCYVDLKKVHYRNGISGLDKLITLLVTEWLADIRQNQIPRYLDSVFV